MIDAIRDLGVNMEIDDFGSGCALIVALQRVAPKRLKIDRAVITPVVHSNGSCQLIRYIVFIGRALGIGVTAEDIEIDPQAEIVSAFGCDRLQGVSVLEADAARRPASSILAGC